MRTSLLAVGVSLLAAAPLAAQSSSATGAPGASAAGPAGAAGTASTPAAGAASTGAAANVTVGATVSDTSGAAVGTITAVTGGNATIDTGAAKAAVPVSSIAKRANGLVIGVTKAQLEAAVANAKPPEIAAGNQVVGPQGNSIGSVTAVNGDLVTLQMPSGKVQLPSKSFAQKPDGTLVIGMTAAQLEAAAKAAGGGSSG